jgi:hypothetical protein
MDDTLWMGLVQFLKEETLPKVSKRRQPTVGVSPDDGKENDKNRPPCQPLDTLQL